MELSHESLLRLVEVELVAQYRRFLRKNLTVSPKTCRFNTLTSTKDGGIIRVCNCSGSKASLAMSTFVESCTGKPCTTQAYAKKCPLYQHFTGVPGHEVVKALTQEFILRLEDPVRRASSFKTLHTLWVLLHEMEVPALGWWCKLQLRFLSKFYARKYAVYLNKNTPKADVTWDRLISNFCVALETSQGE